MEKFYFFTLIILCSIIQMGLADVAVNNSSGPVITTDTSIPLNESQNISLSNDPVSEMVSFVKEAVLYAHSTPKDVALAEFSDRNGSFFMNSFYIYAYDFNGITIAHPLLTELLGKSRLMEEDATGELYIKNLRDTAVNGSGFVIFHYINPVQ